jgi:hypothetical protein
VSLHVLCRECGLVVEVIVNLTTSDVSSRPNACRLPAVPASMLGIFSESVIGEPCSAKKTCPSRNAYVESTNAFVILITNSLGIGRRPSREEDDEASAPLANLKAHVVTCRWKNWICDRYSVVYGSDEDRAQFSK